MLITLFGRIVQFAIMFASVRIMTQLLSPTEMGKVALITTATALFALFLVNPVGMFFNRRLHAWVKSGSARARFHLYGVYLLVVCVLAALSVGIAVRLGVDLGSARPGWIILLVCGSLFFNTVVQTLVPSLNMVGRSRAFIMLTLGTLITGLGASILLSSHGTPTAERWLLGALIGQALFSIAGYLVFFHGQWVTTMPQPAIDATKLRQMLTFCWPIAVSVLLQWLHMQGYRFLLAGEFGLQQLGLYAAGYGIAAALMSAVETILTTWFQPSFYRMANSENQPDRDRAWPDYASAMLPASLLAVTALIAAAPSLPRIMLGPAFHDAAPYVMLGALAEWARMTVGMMSLNAHRHMSTHQLIVPNVLGAVATYGALLGTVHLLGMKAAPLAVFLGSAVIIAFLYGLTFASDPHFIIDFRRLAPSTLLLAIMAVLCAAAQSWLIDLTRPGVPFAACLTVAVVWAMLTWRLQGPSLLHRFRSRSS